MPIRTFARDIEHLCRSFGLSPWTVYVLVFPLVVAGLVDLYRI